jgi:hypothetical protein
MAITKNATRLTEAENAELSRALKALIAASTLRIRLIKACGHKGANPEYDQHYKDAIAHIHQVEEALQQVTDKIRKR